MFGSKVRRTSGIVRRASRVNALSFIDWDRKCGAQSILCGVLRQIVQPGMNMGQDRHMQMVRGNGENQFRLNVRNQNSNGNGNVVAARAEGNAIGNNCNQIRCYNCRGLGHLTRNCTVRARRRDAAYLQTQLLIAQKEEA
nr:hypothetical protein [Tanacetum cinerariifolium]